MTNEGEPMPVTLDQLTKAAASENWDLVDSTIGAVADDEVFLGWAARGLDNEDPNLRDLAASLYERTSKCPDQPILDALTRHMTDDENPYARYRSAFALFHHGVRSEKVVSVIREALDDEDTAEIAKGYLEQL